MGCWGVGIYSNDIAEDLRDACKDLYGLFDAEEALRRIYDLHKEFLAQDWIDDEYASFWYALSDWQWKHGVLTQEVKEKTLSLLDIYAGISDWEESASAREVAKRKGVLDKLKIQLLSPQPPKKIAKIRLAKPKHKPGDILIFKSWTQEEDTDDTLWRRRTFPVPYMFRSAAIQKSPCDNIQGMDLHGRYMAILCVGSAREPHSVYDLSLCDEASLYAAYDFVSEEKPQLSQLQECGFLPSVRTRYEDSFWGVNHNVFSEVDWIYQFMVMPIFTGCTFHVSENSGITYLEKISCPREAQRFHSLLAQKNYSVKYDYHDPLFNIMEAMLAEKERSRLTGIPVDNLLEQTASNPELLTPEETTEAYRLWRNKYIKEKLQG